MASTELNLTLMRSPRRRWSAIRPTKPGHYWTAFRARARAGWVVSYIYIDGDEASFGGKSWGANYYRWMPASPPRSPMMRRRRR